MDKVVDCRKADFIEKVKDLELALQLAESIEDSEAKSMAYLHIFNQTKDFRYLNKSVKYASKCDQKDCMLLTIVECVAKFDRNKAEKIAELIEKEYYKDKAISAIIEQCEALDLITKVSCKKIVSPALKRLALKKKSIDIAMKIPDPYYRAIALMNLSEFNDLEEIKRTIRDIKNKYLRQRLEKMLKSI